MLKSLGGEVHYAKAVPKLIGNLKSSATYIADKGDDAEVIREDIRQAGENPVISKKSNSRKSNPEFDGLLYRQRHLVENLFARLKHFRSIATC